MLTTTFRALTAADACEPRYRHLREHYRGRKLDAPLTFEEILDSNGLNDTLWALCNVGGSEGLEVLRWFATDCAARVAHLAPEARACVETTRRFLRGEATKKELVDAADAARAARKDVWAAWSAWASADATCSARDSSEADEADDADDAARAAWAVRSAWAAANAVWYAREDEAAWQTDRLRLYLTTPLDQITPWPIKEN